MEATTFKQVAQTVTDFYLAKMSTGYWDINQKLQKIGNDNFVYPTVWDINNGLCEDWANSVDEFVKEGECYVEWIEVAENDHCVLVMEGRFYDAENLNGVKHVRNLPIFRKNIKK